MIGAPTFTVEQLKAEVWYDPIVGVFLRKRESSPTAQIGRFMTCRNERGWTMVHVFGSRYRAGRLAWFYMTGRWPEGEIDHKDKCRSNDAFVNLRECSPTQNLANRRCQSNSLTGVKGVTKWGERYKARMRVNGRRIILGTFDTKEEAGLAYNKAHHDLYGEFSYV